MKILNAGITVILALPWLACGNTSAADINIEINGIAEAKGEILVGLFNNADHWPKKGVWATKALAQVSSVKVTFANLPEGEYAVSVIQDVNGNGKLDSNLIGFPIEPYGFSNNSKGNFGPPSFDQAKFNLGTVHKTIAVRLN